MQHPTVFFHSPFSLLTASHHPSLVLQFVLKEMFSILHAPTPCSHTALSCFPFDWEERTSCWHKLQEHAHLLSLAFPSHQELSAQCSQLLIHNEDPLSSLRALYLLLEPCIVSTKDHPDLTMFLLKHHRELALLKELSYVS